MSGELKNMTRCEEVVMKCIWDSQEKLALSDITAMANEKYGRTWKPQTVSTFLSRLVEKGYLVSARIGRYFYYTALLTEQEHKKKELMHLLHFWYGDDKNALLNDVSEICGNLTIEERS